MESITFSHFSEVEESIKIYAPPIVYKYRSWNDDFHKGLLIDKQIWFSHPYDLNDPFDVRPPFAFDEDEIHSQAFYQRLYESAPPWLEYESEEEKAKIVNTHWEKIKLNPKAHFDANRAEIERREKYDQYGIFSTSSDPVSLETWDLYGDESRGYTIGFHTSTLVKELYCTIGHVTYSDAPFPYSFIGNHGDVDVLLYKTTKWSYENEFRFLTLGIGVPGQRLRKFPDDAVAEVILGENATKETENEIRAILTQNYSISIPLYRLIKQPDGSLKRVKTN